MNIVLEGQNRCLLWKQQKGIRQGRGIGMILCKSRANRMSISVALGSAQKAQALARRLGLVYATFCATSILEFEAKK